MAQQIRPTGSRLLRRYEGGHRHAVVCFHHAGGGMSAYRGWVQALTAHADVVLVQLKGREDRVAEPLTDRLDDLAVELAREICELPYEDVVLVGHSMGATVAWAVADAIWAVYRRRVRVVVSAQAPPPYAGRSLPGIPEVLGEPAGESAGESAGTGAPGPADGLHAETLAADLAWMAREFPTFVPRALPVDLHCVFAAHDHLLGPGAAAGWAALTTGRFSHRTVDGGHMYLLTDPAPLLALAGAVAGEGSAAKEVGVDQ
ncbi:thioesterase II family protein [Kitasatospora sp. KL5]|uniref:thioesterase II family protein n=1 Tax=Kitasatospora sp. KL5 TaxID=3425125 RepID=UPI003D6EA7DE